MTLNTSTIRPGLLVSLKTRVTGNVSYYKKVTEEEHQAEDGALVARWETERRIADAEEHDAAAKVRSKARNLIAAVCSHSSFGLLCPESRTPELEQALIAARVLTDEFNAKAKLSRIGFYVITGRVSPDDVEAIRAINSEVRDLLQLMESGLSNLNVDAVRDAASRARSVSQMLAPDAQARVQDAVNIARTAARRIVQAGEQVATEIDQQAIAAVARARTAFLDLDVSAVHIAAPEAEGRAVDLGPDTAPVPVVKKARPKKAKSKPRAAAQVAVE